MSYGRKAVVWVGSIVALTVIAACSNSNTLGSGGGSHPELAAAARARLDAASKGQVAGDPAVAASLSTGDAATVDRDYAISLAGQISAGDTTDYAFDTLSVAAYPLDGGMTDFIAFEAVRGHSSGDVYREVELYHRDTPANPWKATVGAYFNNNIDPPQLKLDRRGRGHLLTDGEMRSQQAQPFDIATRYASAMNDGSRSGRLLNGSFVPSQATTGEVDSEAKFVSAAYENGTASLHWDPLSGGQAVALANGVLVFASVQETRHEHKNIEGNLHFFLVQDAKRLAYGGLLAPGHYSDVTETSLMDLAVLIDPKSLPDVVGRVATNTAVTGVLAPLG